VNLLLSTVMVAHC